MAQRHSSLKIPDIKVIRRLTYFLGQLGLDTCRIKHLPAPPHPYKYSDSYKEWSYGLGLKEAKDLVERTWDYNPLIDRPLPKLQMDNVIHCIKRTRQVMHMLNKLGLKTPDAGLATCKGFVTRHRR